MDAYIGIFKDLMQQTSACAAPVLPHWTWHGWRRTLRRLLRDRPAYLGHCRGTLLITEAGGLVSDLHGSTLPQNATSARQPEHPSAAAGSDCAASDTQLKRPVTKFRKVTMIEITGLTFDYPGHRALDDVTLTVASGSVTALVGPTVREKPR